MIYYIGLRLDFKRKMTVDKILILCLHFCQKNGILLRNNQKAPTNSKMEAQRREY